MQMLTFVLNKVDLLEDVLSELNNAGIKGATVIDSTGMAKMLSESDHGDIPIFGSLKMILNENRPFNKTIFTVLKDENLPVAVDAIKKVVGDLSKPNIGVIFAVPVSFTEGILK